MRLLDLTLPTPAENLALDEALLDEAEQSDAPRETLRLWESDRPMVVVGRSSRLAAEVRLDECRRLGIPVLRRTSGGAAVVVGPGCLMYALVLSYELRPALRLLDRAHAVVLETIARALEPFLPGAEHRGTSDLAVAEVKFSGNSVRCKRKHLLYHGTLLHDFPLALVETCLTMPPRQPDYRRGRGHRQFVANAGAKADLLRRALIAAWDATEPCLDWPRDATARLVAERFGRPDWHEER